MNQEFSFCTESELSDMSQAQLMHNWLWAISVIKAFNRESKKFDRFMQDLQYEDVLPFNMKTPESVKELQRQLFHLLKDEWVKFDKEKSKALLYKELIQNIALKNGYATKVKSLWHDTIVYRYKFKWNYSILEDYWDGDNSASE